MHFTCQWRRGFTLIEMMVVVFIISLLVSITAVAVNRAKEKARQTDCMSNLRQLGVAIVTYRADNRGRNPDWLSNLYPNYIDDKRIYVCRSDQYRGLKRNRPPGLTSEDTESSQKYAITIDNKSADRARYSQNSDIEANSYFYEFSAAPCDWNTANTWAEEKEKDLAIGNKANNGGEATPVPYSSSRMPIVRCFHHYSYGRIKAWNDSGGVPNRNAKPIISGITLNVAYAGNVIISPVWWEGALEPGEER